MNSITFTIPGAPVAKGRARISTRGGFVRAYTPAKTRAYEELVATYAKNAMKRGGINLRDTEAITLEVCFDMPIPASWSKSRRNLAAAGWLPHTSRPDADNMLKAIKDGCNGVVWRDDALVWKVHCQKCYSLNPKTSVIISWGEQ